MQDDPQNEYVPCPFLYLNWYEVHDWKQSIYTLYHEYAMDLLSRASN